MNTATTLEFSFPLFITTRKPTTFLRFDQIILWFGSIPHSMATNSAATPKLAQTLMVCRPGTDDFRAEVSTDLDSIEVSSERGPNGDRYQMTLTLMPERLEPGPIHAQVIIETNDEAFPMLKVPIQGGILPAD